MPFARGNVSAKTSRVDCERVNAKLVLTLRAMSYHQPACGSRCGGVKGKTQLQQILWKCWKKTYLIVDNYFAAFLTFPFLCECHGSGHGDVLLL